MHRRRGRRPGTGHGLAGRDGPAEVRAFFFGAWVQRTVPRAGLLGSIAGIALVLMGFLPLVEIMRVPVVGFAGLGIVLYALIAKRRLPFGIPGVLGAFLVGVLLYYGLGPAGWLGSGYHAPAAWQWRIGFPGRISVSCRASPPPFRICP